MVAEVEAALPNEADPCKLLATRADENADKVLKRWQTRTFELIAKYSDGYINPPAHDRSNPKDVGYPAHWLAVTDYADGPTSYEMPVARKT